MDDKRQVKEKEKGGRDRKEVECGDYKIWQTEEATCLFGFKVYFEATSQQSTLLIFNFIYIHLHPVPRFHPF